MSATPSPPKPWEIGRSTANPSRAPPRKPWENRPPNTSPSTTAAANTSATAASASAATQNAHPQSQTSLTNGVHGPSAIARPGARPWERPGAVGAGVSPYQSRVGPYASRPYSTASSYGGYGSSYGGYGSSYGGYGSSYGGYGGGYGGYGSSYGGYGGYGGYGTSYGSPYGSAYGRQMMPMGGYGAPGNDMDQIYQQQASGGWSLLSDIHSMVNAFGHLSWLLQGNFEALHMFFGSFASLTDRFGHFAMELLNILRTFAMFKYLVELVSNIFRGFRRKSNVAGVPRNVQTQRVVRRPQTTQQQQELQMHPHHQQQMQQQSEAYDPQFDGLM